MRLFSAIELPDDVRRHLARVQDSLRRVARDVSWTRPDNFHVTLKFLGEVPDDRVPGLCDAMARVRVPPPMALSADAIECFPPRGRINVIAAGISGEVESLGTLFKDIELAAREQGIPLEGRVYRPHVTFGRCRSGLAGGLRIALAASVAPLWPGPTFRAEGFVLMQSTRDQKGAVHSVAARYPARAMREDG